MLAFFGWLAGLVAGAVVVVEGITRLIRAVREFWHELRAFHDEVTGQVEYRPLRLAA